MSWSYDNTDLDATTESGRLNIVRLLLGDTDTNDQKIQDEEITFYLGESGNNVYTAASEAAKAIASKYSTYVNVELDGILLVDYSDLASQFYSLASSLEAKAKSSKSTLGFATGTLSTTAFTEGQFSVDYVEDYEG